MGDTCSETENKETEDLHRKEHVTCQIQGLAEPCVMPLSWCSALRDASWKIDWQSWRRAAFAAPSSSFRRYSPNLFYDPALTPTLLPPPLLRSPALIPILVPTSLLILLHLSTILAAAPSVSLWLPPSLSISVSLGARGCLFLYVAPGGARHRSSLPWTRGPPAPQYRTVQNPTKPLQNRTAGAAKPTKPVIPKEKLRSFKFPLYGNTGFVNFAAPAVRFCNGFVGFCTVLYCGSLKPAVQKNASISSYAKRVLGPSWPVDSQLRPFSSRGY